MTPPSLSSSSSSISNDRVANLPKLVNNTLREMAKIKQLVSSVERGFEEKLKGLDEKYGEVLVKLFVVSSRLF